MLFVWSFKVKCELFCLRRYRPCRRRCIFAVRVGDVAVNLAVRQGVINSHGNGHIKHVVDFESDIDKPLSRFVADMPFVRFLFAVFMGEYHGRHRERFAFQPDYVFVVIDLIDRLVSRQVESKELLFAVDFGLAHRGEPVVV